VFCCPRKLSDDYRLIIHHPNAIFTIWSAPVAFLPRVGDQLVAGAPITPALIGSTAIELQAVRVLDPTQLEVWKSGALTNVPSLDGYDAERLQQLDIPTLMNLSVIEIDSQSANLQLQVGTLSPSGELAGAGISFALSSGKPKAQIVAEPGNMSVKGTSQGLFGSSTPAHLRSGLTFPVSGEGERGYVSLGGRYAIRYAAATHQPTLAALNPGPDVAAVTQAATAVMDQGSVQAEPRAAELRETERIAARQEDELRRAEASRNAMQDARAAEARRELEQRARESAEMAEKEKLAAELREMREQLKLLQQGSAVSKPAVPDVAGGPSGARRVALVIGNDAYTAVPKLKNARADAQAMAKGLEHVGFKVMLRLDLTERGMKDALRTFRTDIQGGDEVIVFFAGHGVQLGAANYLLPVDIRGDTEEQVRDEAIPLQRVLDDLSERKARFSLAIVDACRDNPFRGTGRAIGGRGLAPAAAASGQMVIFSAGAGQQALDRLGDNDREANGVFTRVFLREMSRPGVPVDRVVRTVRNEVVRLARTVGHEQVPALYDQTLGDFYFAR
jgi:hypothetical protein